MNIAPHLPPSLQAVADTVLREFSAGVDEPEGLSLIHEWLEVDGWDFLIADLGEQSALKLGCFWGIEPVYDGVCFAPPRLIRTDSKSFEQFPIRSGPSKALLEHLPDQASFLVGLNVLEPV